MNKLLRYSRFRELEEWIQECLEESEEGDEPVCMCLEGQTGIGKSTLVKYYASQFPPELTAESTRIPVFYMQTPSPVSVKGMASAMLDCLGDPGAHKGTLYEMNPRLVNYLNDCEVRLVILDDFHHLVDAKTNRVLREVADWLKVLIKKTNIPFLITGIDGEVQRVLQVNSQLSRLCVREEIKPFVWKAIDARTIRDFAAFISFVESTYNLKLTDEIDRLELLYRIHYATNGVMGYLMYLFRKARRITIKRDGVGSDKIKENKDVFEPSQENVPPLLLELSVLAEAFEKRLRKHVNKENPFTISPKKAFVPAEIGVALDDPHGTTKRGGRRKKREPVASQILTVD